MSEWPNSIAGDGRCKPVRGKILQNDASGSKRPSCPFASPLVHDVGRLNYSSLRVIGAATADLWESW